MSVNWEKLAGDIDTNIKRAAREADTKLALQVSANTRLTQTEVRELFSEPGDLEALARLITIVRGAEQRNQKIQRLGFEAQQLGNVIIKLIDKLL